MELMPEEESMWLVEQRAAAVMKSGARVTQRSPAWVSFFGWEC